MGGTPPTGSVAGRRFPCSSRTNYEAPTHTTRRRHGHARLSREEPVAVLVRTTITMWVAAAAGVAVSTDLLILKGAAAAVVVVVVV